MYHAACKVEFQPFNRLYSQLTSFNFFTITSHWLWTNFFGYTRCLSCQNRVLFYFSVRHAPKTPTDWLGGSRFEVCCYYRTHIHTLLWVHGEGVSGLFSCCVVCCTTTVAPDTPSCYRTGWHRRRSPAVTRSLARPPSFDRPPPLLSSLLPRTDTLLQHQRCVHNMHTTSIVESQCMHPQLSSSPAIYIPGIYKIISLFQGFGQEFFSSRPQYTIRGTGILGQFVRAPASGGGSNAPRPAVSAPHIGVNAEGCRARQARSCKNTA